MRSQLVDKFNFHSAVVANDLQLTNLLCEDSCAGLMDKFNLHSAPVANELVLALCPTNVRSDLKCLRTHEYVGQPLVDDEGSSDASEEPGTVWNEFGVFSTTGSSRRSLVHRHPQFTCELICTPADLSWTRPRREQ